MHAPPRPSYIAILEFARRPPYPIPAESLDEAASVALQAMEEFPGLTRVPVYEWRGPGVEYVLLQTLETDRGYGSRS